MRMTYVRLLKSALAAAAITLIICTCSFASAYRNAYLSGTMPWHRSFRDVNLCTGNLMKSFTDIQVAPARGAGLVLQRTYNSNDDRIGPFGRGWTHAYEIRMEEIQSVPDPSDPYAESTAVRTDFFGGKHKYTRDADGLYTPPPYVHDWTVSDYKSVLEVGPGDVNQDIEIGLDGTTKHFIAQGNVRVCDYIEDRHGNRTNLAYDPTTGLLDTVTDPSGRVLDFTWTNFGTQQSPTWRITQVTGPLQAVTYAYWQTTDQDYATYGGGEPYNLKSVTLDPNGLARTTTYTYTTCAGETGLLAQIRDPLYNPNEPTGHVVSYSYLVAYPDELPPYEDLPTITGTVWVDRVTEPGGVDPSTQELRTLDSWIFGAWNWDESCYETTVQVNDAAGEILGCSVTWASTPSGGLTVKLHRPQSGWWNPVYTQYEAVYDKEYNVISRGSRVNLCYDDISFTPWRTDMYYYGRFGNVLYHWVDGFSDADPTPENFNLDTAYGVDKYEYYTEDKYFQKKKVTDTAGHVTTFDYGDRYGSSGNKGNLLWVRDALHQPDGTAFTYEYDQYGQKVSETNLNGIITTFDYADDWGNLTQVVQDLGEGHLNRTTDMVYDEAGRVTERTDPMSRTSTVDYNALGQPDTATFPAPYAEAVSYSYGDNGRLNSVTDNRGATSLAYESGCDRVSNVTDPITGTISYTYTPFGSVTTKALPDGNTLHYTYAEIDEMFSGSRQAGTLADGDPNSIQELLEAVKDDEGHVLVCRNPMLVSFVPPTTPFSGSWFNVKYDQYDSVISYCKVDDYCDTATFGTERRTHGWLNKKVNKYFWKDELGQWQSKVLSKNEYEYDAMGNRTENRVYGENGTLLRTEDYDYDDLNHLTYVDYGEGSPQTQTYTFDDMGNRLSMNATTYGYNAANMLTTLDGQTYGTYDANGNQLTGGGRTNVWDSQNRLASCLYNGVTSTFSYGADGLRRSMTVNGTTAHFALEGQSVVHEGHLDQGNFVADVTYLNGPRGVEYRKDESTGAVRWYLYDGLGSVVAEVDEDGNITSTTKYDVYGSVRGSTGTSDSQHKFVGALGHTTEPDMGGLIYMRARWMDPVTGRFICEDPAKDGLNWFEYCSNNPTSMVDLDGQAAISAANAALILGAALAVCKSIGIEINPSIAHIGLAVTLGRTAIAAGAWTGAAITAAGSYETGGVGVGLAAAAGIAGGATLTGVMTTLAIEQVVLAIMCSDLGL